MITPLLIYEDILKLLILEIKCTFDFTIGIVLSQLGENDFLHTNGFNSCKISFY
jgi:hypothetical protein